MTNPYYTKTGNPATSSSGSSALMRAEFAAIETAFDLLPTLSGNSKKLVRVNSGGTAQEAVSSVSDVFVQPRVVTLTDAATVTPNADTTDIGILTTLSQTTTIANPTGTPVNGQRLMLRIKSGTSRTLSWGAKYRASSDLTPIPTATTGSSKTDYLGFIYNSADDTWDFVAKVFGF